MSGVLEELPCCRAFVIERGLRSLGFVTGGARSWDMMEEDEAQTAGMATVHDGERVGVASADYDTPERDTPVIRWANSDGELLRIWQSEMRRLAHRVGQVHLPILMRGMQ